MKLHHQWLGNFFCHSIFNGDYHKLFFFLLFFFAFFFYLPYLVPSNVSLSRSEVKQLRVLKHIYILYMFVLQSRSGWMGYFKIWRFIYMRKIWRIVLLHTKEYKFRALVQMCCIGAHAIFRNNETVMLRGHQPKSEFASITTGPRPTTVMCPLCTVAASIP